MALYLSYACCSGICQGNGGAAKRKAVFLQEVNAMHITVMLLIEEFGKLGFLPYVEKAVQGPIITTFLYPDTDFDFAQMYRFIKERGYAIYPGKLTDKDTFRIGTIGEIYEEDILRLTQIMKEYMESRGN